MTWRISTPSVFRQIKNQQRMPASAPFAFDSEAEELDYPNCASLGKKPFKRFS
jgi:hypothetical protein